jgi:gamma-glutamyltranspeptidase/glutathione hydrolase
MMSQGDPCSGRPELSGSFGMVASTHWLASAAGMSVLEAGGNAFDAASAAGFVLQVVEPHLSGPAGEVPILLWSQSEQQVHVVCGQGVAPMAANLQRFRELGCDLIPGNGLLAATVPGAFGGWMLLLERWGTWRLRDVLKFAIGYARHGFRAAPLLATTIESGSRLFREEWATSAELWLRRDGKSPSNGSRICIPALADTYERVVTEAERRGDTRESEIRAAEDCWYRGFVSEAIVRFCHDKPWLDVSGERHYGLLDGDDLAQWHPTTESAATYDFGRYTVCKTGPWGQGPVMLQQLALLHSLDIESVRYGSSDYMHLLIEAGKLAFADREAWYGDSGSTPNVVDQLLSDTYNNSRSRLIEDTASLVLRPGSIEGKEPVIVHRDASVPRPSESSSYGEPTLGFSRPREGDTCHVDVVDRFGNMVSATPSGGWLQSSPTIPELGFCLGTRAQMFWLPGHPNSLRPGARPRTTLTPSLALQDGRPWMAFGTPGGDQQDQWNLAFFCSIVLGGLGLQSAIDAPAFTSQHFPSSFYPRAARPGHILIEERMPAAVVADLRERGHDVELVGPWVLGRLSAVAVGHDGFLLGAANTRGGQGYVVGR